MSIISTDDKNHSDDALYAENTKERAAKGTDVASVGSSHGNLIESTAADGASNGKGAPDTTEVADSVRRHLEPEV